jgi:hypothetical protein
MSELEQPHHHAVTEDFKRTVSLADTLWTFAGLLGWKDALLATIIVAGGWVGGYVRGEPVVSLSMSAIALFSVLTFLTKLPAIANTISSRPDVRVWQLIQNLTLGEAACLLAGINPSPGMSSGFFPSPNAMAFYRLLAEAVLRGELEKSTVASGSNVGLGQMPDQINFGTFITRTSLQKFAQKHGFKQRFLR